jgi:hypothetical protein
VDPGSEAVALIEALSALGIRPQARHGTDLRRAYWLEAQLWQQVCPTLVCGPSRFASAVIAVLCG